jgi:hypothetical protein
MKSDEEENEDEEDENEGEEYGEEDESYSNRRYPKRRGIAEATSTARNQDKNTRKHASIYTEEEEDEEDEEGEVNQRGSSRGQSRGLVVTIAHPSGHVKKSSALEWIDLVIPAHQEIMELDICVSFMASLDVASHQHVDSHALASKHNNDTSPTLRSILSHLTSRTFYASLDSYLSDLMLLFQHVRRNNSPSSDIFLASISLQEEFRFQLKSVFSASRAHSSVITTIDDIMSGGPRVSSTLPTASISSTISTSSSSSSSSRPSLTTVVHTPLTHRDVTKLHAKLIRSKQASPFSLPVDPSLPLYHDTIHSPMDLATIQTRLQGHGYQSMEQYAYDVRLVFANARMFNEPDSEIYQATMFALFISKLADSCIYIVLFSSSFSHRSSTSS